MAAANKRSVQMDDFYSFPEATGKLLMPCPKNAAVTGTTEHQRERLRPVNNGTALKIAAYIILTEANRWPQGAEWKGPMLQRSVILTIAP